LAFFTSPAPPFLAAPLAVAELRAFFAISFTSVAVAAGCYSPDALPQQPRACLHYSRNRPSSSGILSAGLRRSIPDTQ
jgi:hypothetical protein